MLLRILLIFSLFFTLACSDDEEESPNPKIAIKIETQPVNATAYDSLYTSFSVSVTGTDPKYQWYRDGVAFSTNAQCDVHAVASNEDVDFYCVVSNDVNSVVTDTVQLAVLESPAIVRDEKGMVKVPSGGVTALMGSVSPKASGHEGPVHNVTFTNSFWMDSVPVSELEFDTLMSTDHPTIFFKMPWIDSVPRASSPQRPATSLSWNDAVLYCNAKNADEEIKDSLYRYTIMLDINYEGDTTAQVNMTDSLLYRTYDEFDGTDTNSVTKIDTVVIKGDVLIIPEDTTYSNLTELIDTTFDTTDTKIVDTTYDTTATGEINKLYDTTFITIDTVVKKLDTGVDTTVYDTLLKADVDTLTKPSIYKKFTKTIKAEVEIEITPHNGYYLTDFVTVELDSAENATATIPVGTYVVDIVNDTVKRDTLEYLEDFAKYETVYTLDTMSNTINGVGAVTEFNGYRLPTEAEWEFAVRARSGSDYFWGSEDLIDQYAWYEGNSKDGSGVVRLQMSASLEEPNVYGLHDMSGNVWEWCHDYYGAYTAADAMDPTGPAVGTSKVRRGGSARDLPVYLRSSERGKADPLNRNAFVGLRTVRNALE